MAITIGKPLRVLFEELIQAQKKTRVSHLFNNCRAYLNDSCKNLFDVGPYIPTFLGHVKQAAVIRDVYNQGPP